MNKTERHYDWVKDSYNTWKIYTVLNIIVLILLFQFMDIRLAFAYFLVIIINAIIVLRSVFDMQKEFDL